MKAADAVGRETRGYDAGKMVAGRKRFIVTDTPGLLITVTGCAASVQDRDGTKGTLLGMYLTLPRCRFVFADAGFAGCLVGWACGTLRTTLSIVRNPSRPEGATVLPRRRAVAGIADRTPRLARHYEREPVTSEAMIRWTPLAL